MLLPLAALACAGSTAPDRPVDEPRPGTLVLYQDGPWLVVPDTVTAGRPALVLVGSYGHTSCVERAGVDVEDRGAVLVVRPRSSCVPPASIVR